MRWNVLLLLLLSAVLRAETYTMTLREAVATALKQNPDIALARLDEEKARQAIRLAKDPFTPRITVGSGLAYSNGFPMSIEGSAPTIFRADAAQSLFNRPQSFAVAQAKEHARGAGLAVAGKRDEVAYRAAALFLEAERARKIGALARKDADSLQSVLATVQAQIKEGRALPLAGKQAEYNMARARALAQGLDDDRESAETSLAVALGFTADDRIQPAGEQRPAPGVPSSEETALRTALESNNDLRQLESQMLAKQIEFKGFKAARWPQADLVAQYGLMAKFNNYEQFFRAFQRNNGQIGVSLQLPILTGPAVSAQTAQNVADVSKLKLQFAGARNQIQSEVQASYRDMARAETAADLARLDLEVAREQLSVYLAQMQEGRTPLSQVEQARITENQKWIAFYDAQYTLEKARWNVLRLTGELATTISTM